MAIIEVFANSYSTALSAAVTSIATTITINDTPPLALQASNSQWRILIDSELMLVTAVSSLTLTVTRAIEGTSAASHLVNAQVTHILTADALLNFGADPGTFEARLSLSSTLAVSVSDITNSVNIYLLPYMGCRISLYDGARWAYYVLNAGIYPSASLVGSAGAVQDVFAYGATGNVHLVFVNWTNTTTRATALSVQDGVVVLSTDSTRRYIGTIYFNAANQVSDSESMRGNWNYYNRVARPLQAIDHTASYVYSVATTRQANANTANQVGIVTGVAEETLTLFVSSQVAGTSAGGNNIGFGEDSITAFMTVGVMGGQVNVITGDPVTVSSMLIKVPLVGYHYYAWLEQGSGAGTDTWYGDGSGVRQQFSGMIGSIDC